MEKIETVEFIEKLKNKDSASIHFIVNSYTKPLFSSLLKMGYSDEEAEDLIQNTWITFFDVLNRFEGKSKVKTFLYGIMFNKISEYKRKTIKLKNNISIEEIIDNNFDENDHWNRSILNPEKNFYNSQISKIIQSCLDLIPEKQKLAFQLKEIEGEDSEEICKILEIKVNNLGVLLFRARNQLRECIEMKTQGKGND